MLIHAVEIISKDEWEEGIYLVKGFEVHTKIEKGETVEKISLYGVPFKGNPIVESKMMSITKSALFRGKNLTWFVFNGIVFYAREGVEDTSNIVEKAFKEYEKCYGNEL